MEQILCNVEHCWHDKSSRCPSAIAVSYVHQVCNNTRCVKCESVVMQIL